MFARDKETKPKSDERAFETVTPLSDVAVLNPMPIPQPDKAPILAPRVVATPPTIAPRDAKGDGKNEAKRLIVGRGISLGGKISSCDRLVIDGRVEAELEDCHTVEVTENGTFKGAAEIAGADISGHYDGSLTVRENLLIRGTGRVSGTVRYGRLHIEDGGEINGDVKSITDKS
jgi:cytoskeletal protein CcmA (bactofilin family)